jgi:hypothetical protein
MNRIIAAIAKHEVCSIAPEDEVFPITAIDAIASMTGEDHIIALISTQEIAHRCLGRQTTGTAEEGIIAKLPFQGVRPLAPINEVVILTPEGQVIAIAGGDGVITSVAQNQIIANAAIEEVGAIFVDAIGVQRTAHEGIVALVAVEGVSAAIAEQ